MPTTWTSSCRATAALTALALVMGACSAQSTTNDGDGGGAALDLGAVTLASDTVRELGTLRFLGLPRDADLSELEAFLVDGDTRVQLLLFGDEEGVHTEAPLTPSDPGSGGSVEVELREGDDTVTLPLELTGLPSADGTFDALIDDLLEMLDERARAFGSSLTEVRETPYEQLDDQLAIIQLVAGLVDDGTPNDLESLLDGEDLSAEDRSLLDAVLAELSPLRIIAPPSGLPPLQDPAVAAPPPGGGRVTAAGPDVRAAPAPASGAAAAATLAATSGCREFPLRITDGQELADAMAVGIDAQIPEGGAVDTLFKDLGSLGAASAEIPVLGQIMGVVGTVVATIKLWHNADAGRYPSFFSSLRAGVSTLTFNEDYTRPGSVASVIVTAESTGFNAAEDLAAIVASIVESILAIVLNKVIKEELSGRQNDAMTVSGRLRGALTTAILARLGAELVTWCPQSWAVEIGEPRWIELFEVANIAANDDTLTYEPTAVGRNVLGITADPDAFSGATIRRDVTTVTERLDVDVAPTEIRLDRPGERVEITTTLTNADTRTLFWNAGPGQWADGTGADTNDDGTRPLTTPGNPAEYPFQVTVESTSRTGLRENASDVRHDTMTVRLQELFIKPSPGRTRPEGTIDFTAVDADGQPVDADWEATGGDIDSDGRYVAGEEEGTFVVEATSEADPDQQATASIIISDIEPCTFVFSYAGSVQSPEGRYSGPVTGTAAFSIDEYDQTGGSRQTRGGMTALNVDAGGGRVAGLTSLSLADQVPHFVQLVPLGRQGPAPAIPLDGPGSYIRSGTAELTPDGAEASFTFDGDFEITITDSALLENDGQPFIDTLEGTFRSAGPLDVRAPFDELSGEIFVSDGEFSIDREACPGFAL